MAITPPGVTINRVDIRISRSARRRRRAFGEPGRALTVSPSRVDGREIIHDRRIGIALKVRRNPILVSGDYGQ